MRIVLIKNTLEKDYYYHCLYQGVKSGSENLGVMSGSENWELSLAEKTGSEVLELKLT